MSGKPQYAMSGDFHNLKFLAISLPSSDSDRLGHYGPERPTVHNRYGTGFCSGWLVWKQTSPDWQRDKSRRRSGLVMQYHRVISDAVTKSSYQKQLLQWCQERHQRDALKSRTLSVRCDDSTLPRTMRCNALSASACEASQASPRSTSVAGSA